MVKLQLIRLIKLSALKLLGLNIRNLQAKDQRGKKRDTEIERDWFA